MLVLEKDNKVMIHNIEGKAIVFIKDISCGLNKIANAINVQISFDDNHSYAKLIYFLYNVSKNEKNEYILSNVLSETEGENPSIEGNDYENWVGDAEYAFEYVCNKLNLEIKEQL